MASARQLSTYIHKSVVNGHWVRAVMLLRTQLCTQPWRPGYHEGEKTQNFPSAVELHKKFLAGKKSESSKFSSPTADQSDKGGSSTVPAMKVKSSLSSLSRSRLSKTTAKENSATYAQSPAGGEAAEAATFPRPSAAEGKQIISTSQKFPGYAQTSSEGGLEAAIGIGFGLWSIDCPNEEASGLLVAGCNELLPTLITKAPIAAMYLLEAAHKYDLLPRLTMSVLHQAIVDFIGPRLVAPSAAPKPEAALVWPMFAALVLSRPKRSPTTAINKMSPLSLLDSQLLINRVGGKVVSLADPEQFQIFSDVATTMLSAVHRSHSACLGSEEAMAMFAISLGGELCESIILENDSNKNSTSSGEKNSNNRSLLEHFGQSDAFVTNAAAGGALEVLLGSVWGQEDNERVSTRHQLIATVCSSDFREQMCRRVTAQFIDIAAKPEMISALPSVVSTLSHCIEFCEKNHMPRSTADVSEMLKVIQAAVTGSSVEGGGAMGTAINKCFGSIIRKACSTYHTTREQFDKCVEMVDSLAANGGKASVAELRRILWFTAVSSANPAVKSAAMEMFVANTTSPLDDDVTDMASAIDLAATDVDGSANRNSTDTAHIASCFKPVKLLTTSELALRLVFGSFATERTIYGNENIITLLEAGGSDTATLQVQFEVYNRAVREELMGRLSNSATASTSKELSLVAQWLLRAVRPRSLLNNDVLRTYCGSVWPCAVLGLPLPQDINASQLGLACLQALRNSSTVTSVELASYTFDSLALTGIAACNLRKGADSAIFEEMFKRVGAMAKVLLAQLQITRDQKAGGVVENEEVTTSARFLLPSVSEAIGACPTSSLAGPMVLLPLAEAVLISADVTDSIKSQLTAQQLEEAINVMRAGLHMTPFKVLPSKGATESSFPLSTKADSSPMSAYELAASQWWYPIMRDTHHTKYTEAIAASRTFWEGKRGMSPRAQGV